MLFKGQGFSVMILHFVYRVTYESISTMMMLRMWSGILENGAIVFHAAITKVALEERRKRQGRMQGRDIKGRGMQ